MQKVLKMFLSAAGLMLAVVSSFAQSYSVTARLKDASNGEAVSFATVSMIQKGASKVYKYSLSANDGKFIIEQVRPGAYILKVELLGYKMWSGNIDVKGTLDMGEIKIEPDREQLDAASVSAVGNPIVIKKDTIEYNASSFKTTDNDALEDLLKKLPGVEVSEDGSITVNGEAITKITIDGKTFFLDDPQLASKNIPAKIVSKVKVVEKKSEQAEFTGISDGEEETVIDLSIKPGMMKGLFGNIMLGAGHDMPSDKAFNNDARFQGAGFMGKFSDKSQISVILNANNTNNRGFNDLAGSMMGGMMGGGGPMGMGQGGFGGRNGITTSYMGGVNGAFDLFDDKMELSGNYLYNQTNQDIIQSSEKVTYLPASDYNLIYDNDGMSNRKTYGNRVGIRLDHKFSENSSIFFEPQINFGGGNYMQSSRFATYMDEKTPEDLANDGFSLTSGYNKNWTASGFLLFRQRLGIPGRTITAMTRFSFSDNDMNGLNQSLTSSYDTGEKLDSTINQRFEQNRNNMSLMGRVTYTEPLGGHFYLEANYEYNWNKSRSNKDTYDSGLFTSFSMDEHNYNRSGEQYNFIYSNNILNEYINQAIGANFMYQVDKFRAQVGFSARPTKTHNETMKAGQIKGYDSQVVNWSPQVMVWGDPSDNLNLRVFYMGRSSQPSTSQLMPVPDNSDPLNVSFGNPSLKPYFSHNIRGDIRYNNRKNFFSFNVRFSGGFVKDPVVSAIWYGANGAQYSMPYNGPSSGQGNVHLFANIPIAKSDFSINNSTSVNYSQTSSYVGTVKDVQERYYADGQMDYEAFLADYSDISASSDFRTATTRTTSVMERLTFVYRSDALEIRAGGRTRFNRSTYDITEGAVTNTWNNQLSASANWTWEYAGMTLKSNFRFNWYDGYTTPQANEYVLDAEINKLLFKDKVTLAAKCYDILGQSKNLTVSDSANNHTETLNNTLGRYIVVSLTYRFGELNRNSMHGPGGHRH